MPTEREYDDIACKAAGAVEALRLAMHYADRVDDYAYHLLSRAYDDAVKVRRIARDEANNLRNNVPA